MRRRIVLLLPAALALLAPATAGPAAADLSVKTVGLFAYRTTTGAATVDIRMASSPRFGDAVYGFAAPTYEHGRITGIFFAGSHTAGNGRVQLRAADRHVVLCDHGVCVADIPTRFSGFGVGVENGGPDDEVVINALFVVGHGRGLNWQVKEAEGWTVRTVPLPARWVSSRAAAGDAGAYTPPGGLEVFTEAAAPGGRSGSIAVARPPCGTYPVARQKGVGTLSLSGGKTSPSLTCPVDWPAIWSWAERGTTWRATGPVVGDPDPDARLFVFDLPARLPFPTNWPWR